MRQVEVKCILRVFSGPMKDKPKECTLLVTLPRDYTGGLSKRYAERCVRNHLHSLLKLTDRTGVDPELLMMAATGLQVNVLLATEIAPAYA